jgi:hypothetical protein
MKSSAYAVFDEKGLTGSAIAEGTTGDTIPT